MGINIWLPIIVNILILGIMVAGVVIGKKNGGAHELIKLGALCIASIGIYFLSPIFTNLLLKIGFVSQLLEHDLISVAVIKSIAIILLFVIAYILITILLKVAKKINKNRATLNIRYAKPAKIVGLDTKETKRLRKEHKQMQKAQRKEQKKLEPLTQTTKSKVLGVVFGLILAIFVGFVATLPVKPILEGIANAQPEISDVTKGYEYTPYGQLDKVTDVVDTLLK